VNQDIKAEWLAELRSGTRKQGKRFLQKDGQFCCLGVLCEVAVKHDITSITGNKNAPLGRGTAVTYDEVYIASLPDAVSEWAGISRAEAFPSPYGDQPETSATNVLMNLNDMHEWTFPQIADWIEENL
jgi:hypothetical protein